MRIAVIEAIPAWIGRRNQLLVKVETDDGLVGWGEAGLSGRELAVVGAVEHYREFLIGKDPRRIGALWQEMYRSQYFEGGRVLTAAISAIDIALYDITGKALGVPVYELLGGKQREYVPVLRDHLGAATGRPWSSRRKLLVEQGWACFRLSAARHEADDVFDPRASIAETRTAGWLESARGGGQRAGAGHRLSPPPERGRDGVVLPEDAHAARSTSWKSRSATSAPRPTSAAHADRRAARHRRGVRVQVAVPALHRAGA